MREFFVQKLDPEIGSLFLLHSFSLAFFFRMWYSHFIERMFYFIF